VVLRMHTLERFPVVWPIEEWEGAVNIGIMNTTNLFQFGVIEILRRFKAGSCTPAAYMAELLARSRVPEQEVRAFVYLAEEIEPGSFDGALALSGIPVGIKDVIDTAGLPTSYGSRAYENHVPEQDAWIVNRFNEIGAYVFGKTATTEFAWRNPGRTVNPWDYNHTPGGSSSGSAAAVAAGFVPLAIGTQTLGSVIRPAAYCGVVGFKPSFGAIPRTGVHPLSGSLDHVGFFARSVDDAALALSVTSGSDPQDPASSPLASFSLDLENGLDPLGPPRLLLMRPPFWERVQPAQRALLEAVANKFVAAGATVEIKEWPENLKRIWALANTILSYEAALIHSDLISRAPDKTSDHLKELVKNGQETSEEIYASAREQQALLRSSFSEVFAGIDAILGVPAFGEAPFGLSDTGDAAFCTPWTFLGLPAITLPVGFGPAGLPLGIQLTGANREDFKLARIAAWCERVIAYERSWPFN
jgi:Asp-tRNA(Asn)/Glu-tRNA(Gln) amidotransferase A subunit family amidase